MYITHIKEYIRLAENLNFTLTANEFHIAQATLSKHIANIEEEFGVQLFIRTTHKVELTREGKIVFKVFKKIAKEYDNLAYKMNEISNEVNNNLTIGILYYGFIENIAPMVKKFKYNYPEINLKIMSCQLHTVFQNLKNNLIDIGVILRTGSLPDTLYDFYLIEKKEIVAITLPNHPFAKKEKVSLAELSRETQIFTSKDKELQAFMFDLLKKHNALSENIVDAKQVDMFPLILDETNGVFFGQDLLKDIPRNDLVFTKIDADDFYIDMCLAYKKNRKNKAIKLFVQTCKSVLK